MGSLCNKCKKIEKKRKKKKKRKEKIGVTLLVSEIRCVVDHAKLLSWVIFTTGGKMQWRFNLSASKFYYSRKPPFTLEIPPSPNHKHTHLFFLANSTRWPRRLKFLTAPWWRKHLLLLLLTSNVQILFLFFYEKVRKSVKIHSLKEKMG